jgi:hypothetical protein
MGLDRKLFISNRWDVEDVKDTLESLFSTKVKYEATHSPDYSMLHFTVGDDQRSMSVFTGYEVGGFKGVLLSLGASGKSNEIFKALAERLGGFYNEQDCDSNYVEYPFIASSSLEYLLKDAVKTGATDGRSSEAFREYLKKSEEESKRWAEENSRRIMEGFGVRRSKKGK